MTIELKDWEDVKRRTEQLIKEAELTIAVNQNVLELAEHEIAKQKRIEAAANNTAQ